MKSKDKDGWLVGKGKYEGHSLVVRQNVGARSIIGDARYPYRLGIAIPLKTPQKDGMPANDEIQILGRVEDLIYDYFHAKQNGILCLIITTQGMREFIVYVTTDDVIELIEALSYHFPQYNIQHYIEQDKNWDAYKQWSL